MRKPLSSRLAPVLWWGLALNLAALFLGARWIPTKQLMLALVVLAGVNALTFCVCALFNRAPKSPQVLASEDFSSGETWPVAMAVFDARGRLHSANHRFRELFGFSDGERIENVTIAQLMHPDERESLTALQTQMFNSVAPTLREEKRFFRRDGVPFHGRWTVQGPANGQGQRAVCLIEDITQTTLAEHDLKQARAALHDLYEIVAGGRELDGQIEALLALGCRRFAVETGFVGQAHEMKLRLVGVHSADERLRRGQIYDLSAARREGDLVRPQGPRGLLHVGIDPEEAQKGNVSRIFTQCEGETYLGAPILVNGILWGTLNFSDPEGREAISSDDGEFLQVMAGWLGGEIERRHARAQLEAQQVELVKAGAQLEQLVMHDGLTGVKNRRAFDEQFQSEWQRAKRYLTPLTVVLIDVDKFKQFNDTYGHQAGDETLQRVAKILGNGVRNIDFLARYGGEEFVLILPNTDAQGAQILAERLRYSIEQAHWPLRPVTASFGLATLEASTADTTALLKSADDALYAAKEAGRNCCIHARTLQVLAE